MTLGTDPPQWSRCLAPDVRVVTDASGMVLRTTTDHVTLGAQDAVMIADTLLSQRDTARADTLDGSTRAGTAVVDQLDQRGLVAHRLNDDAAPVLTCIPLRASPGAKPRSAPSGKILMAPQAFLRAHDGGLSLEMPGAWARIAIHDSRVLDTLPLLAAGCEATALAEALLDRSDQWINAVICALQWCGIVGTHHHSRWALHDLSLHTATRQGYGRTLIGKTGQTGPAVHDQPTQTLARIDLPLPNQTDLSRRDPPFADVTEHRRSRRQHGAAGITMKQVSEFLFRTLHNKDGHRPYPSGGGCYPLTAYLAVDRCLDLPPGLYRYDAQGHCLYMVAQTDPALNQLLDDAAVAAGVTERPQTLLILSAHFARTSETYQGLAYSLILKEVGAVFQMAMLSAAVMNLAACPLGTGDALAFSKLARLDPLVETSVGEMMIGAMSQDVP